MKPFTAAFQAAVRELFDGARQTGVSMSQLCRSAKVARNTPDRWLEQPPKSLRLLDQLQAELDAERARRAEPKDDQQPV